MPQPAGKYRRASKQHQQGSSESVLLEEAGTGRKFLFKPSKGEAAVERAQRLGIAKGDYAPRALAGSEVARFLDLPSPSVELVVIDGRPGSLTEWIEGPTMMSLVDYGNQLGGKAAFQAFIDTPEFRRELAKIDALDYLINNVDRGENWGNYLIELGPTGEMTRLWPIDMDLSFTSTQDRATEGRHTRGLPETYSPEMVANLQSLGQNRNALVDMLRPLVGEEAVQGVLHRLDLMLVDIEQRRSLGKL